jgi:hypothetical protein
MMQRRLLCSVVALLALAVAPSASRSEAARGFLATAFTLSPADISRIDNGEVVSRTLDVNNRREVATLGIVRIRTTPATYVERLADIVSFKRTESVLQIGRFSNPPQPADLTSLTIEDADLKRLRECRVDACEIRLSADGIERVQREIDWRDADASLKATGLMRQLLADYVARYRHGGASAAMEYANRLPRLNVGVEFASLVGGDTVTGAYAPQLRRHLLDYPAASLQEMTDFVYWSKELVRGRPVVSITHVAIATGAADSSVAYAIGSKQIYAMHYFDASLGLTLLVPDRTASTPATYVVYLNRSRIDLFDGVFGGITRRIVAGRARGVVAEQLERLQRVFSSDWSQKSRPADR